MLIADDDADTRQVLQDAVRSLGHVCTVARDGIEAWNFHHAHRADVILSDWSMPRLDGLSLCKRLRSAGGAPAYTHFIFVTGSADKTHFMEGMHAGADDYITKPFDIDALEARLEVCRRAVMIQRQELEATSSLRRKSDRNFLEARTDALTSVSNRLALAEDLDALASEDGGSRRLYSGAMCDIDRFKEYNDCFGHVAGDDVLRRVAQTLQDGLRRGDGFYRYGGEEFVALLRDQSLEEATTCMVRVRAQVEALRIPHAARAEMPYVTVSVGIAELRPGTAAGSDDWLRRADRALYAAKASGRNCVITERADDPPHST